MEEATSRLSLATGLGAHCWKQHEPHQKSWAFGGNSFTPEGKETHKVPTVLVLCSQR